MQLVLAAHAPDLSWPLYGRYLMLKRNINSTKKPDTYPCYANRHTPSRSRHTPAASSSPVPCGRATGSRRLQGWSRGPSSRDYQKEISAAWAKLSKPEQAVWNKREA